MDNDTKVEDIKTWVLDLMMDSQIRMAIEEALRNGKPTSQFNIVKELMAYAMPKIKSEDYEQDIQEPNITINFNEIPLKGDNEES